ncbi:MAG: 2-oxoacid:acceptor oxidoreductase family protein [Omnitrophica bacterium]|nr:2-oxoacid:acceptor oxidoreductase family protein [Candidatus Omnitrophota bacterium]
MNILKLFKKRRVRAQTEIPDKPERLEIVLSGSGGQGMILAGKILSEAASIYDTKEAVMAQSYGPEARGGASKAEIIISSQSIYYPRVTQADILLAMTQEALDKYVMSLKKEGLLVVDDTFIKEVPQGFVNVFKAPFSALAIKLLNAPIVANIIALGAIAAITKIISREALIQAVLARVPEKILVSDRMAIDTGFKLVNDSNFQWSKRSVNGK